jgi:hypothetical protein
MQKECWRVGFSLVLLPSMVAAWIAGCGTMKNAQTWGKDAWTSLTWKKTGYAAYDAFMDLQTLIPAIGAVVFCLDDFDQETSDWAGRQHPIFQSAEAAEVFSDWGQYLLVTEPFVTAFFTPSSDESKEWMINKAKGISVEMAATGLVAGTTLLLKQTTHRLRPNGIGSSSFPSGHTSSSFAGATLANNNLNLVPVNRYARTSVQAFNLLLATAVGWARIEAREHYPSDVLAGAAIGHFLSSFLYGTFSGLPEESQFGLVIAPLHKKGVAARLTMRF